MNSFIKIVLGIALLLISGSINVIFLDFRVESILDFILGIVAVYCLLEASKLFGDLGDKILSKLNN